MTVAPVRAINFVSLAELRAMPELATSPLLARGNRLSVLPLTDEQFAAIVDYADGRAARLAELAAPTAAGATPRRGRTRRGRRARR